MTNIFNSAGTLEVIFKVSPAWFVAHRLRRRRSWWWELRMSLERGRGPHRLSQGPEPHTLQAQRWRMTSLVREPHMWWPVQHTSAPEFGTPWVQGMLCCFPPTHKAKLGCRRPNQKPNQPVCWTQRNEVFVTSNLGLTKTNFSKKGSKMPKLAFKFSPEFGRKRPNQVFACFRSQPQGTWRLNWLRNGCTQATDSWGENKCG